MTLRHLLPVLFVAVSVGFVYAVVRLSRWHAGYVDDVDALIAINAAKPVTGMERVDWTKVARAEAQRKLKVLRAQRKARKKPQPSKPRIVRRIA